MPLPTWLTAIRDPARAYMLLSGAVPRPAPRFLRRGSPQRVAGYALLSSGGEEELAQLTDEQMQRSLPSAGASTAFHWPSSSLRRARDRWLPPRPSTGPLHGVSRFVRVSARPARRTKRHRTARLLACTGGHARCDS